MRKRFILINILLIVFAAFLACGCGEVVESTPTHIPISYKASDNDWAIEIVSIHTGKETIRSTDGGSLDLVGDTVFLFVSTILTGNNPDKVCISTGEGKVTGNDGTTYRHLAISSASGYYNISPPGSLSIECAMSGYDEDSVEFVFILPIDVEPEIFQFKDLTSIVIRDMLID